MFFFNLTLCFQCCNKELLIFPSVVDPETYCRPSWERFKIQPWCWNGMLRWRKEFWKPNRSMKKLDLMFKMLSCVLFKMNNFYFSWPLCFQSFKGAKGAEFYIWGEHWTEGPGRDVCVQLLTSYQDVWENGSPVRGRHVSGQHTMYSWESHFSYWKHVLLFFHLSMLGPAAGWLVWWMSPI